MRFKPKQISLAVGLAFAAGVAGQASALTLDQYDANTINVYLTGSTALDPAIEAYMRVVCASSVDTFGASGIDQTTYRNALENIAQNVQFLGPQTIYSTAAIKQTMYFCQLRNDTTVTDPTLRGKKVLVRKSSGDSGEGIVAGIGAFGGPVFMTSPNTSVLGVNANYGATTVCGTTPTSTVAASGALVAENIYTCTSSNVPVTLKTAPTVVGLADVEPSLINQFLSPQVDLTTSGIQAKNIAANIWGIAVSLPFRNALQKAQSITVGDDTEAGMPSLSKAALLSIISGQIPSVSKLTDSTGTVLSSVAGVTAPANTTFYLVRRPDSSGTNTSIRATLLGEGCTPGVAGMAPIVGNVCGTSSVFVGQGTGNLLDCLTTLNTQNKWGLGFAATTNVPVVNNGIGWRWIKVDGASPSIINSASGKYDIFTEATLEYIGDGSGNPNTGDANANKVVTEMIAQLGQPTVLASINTAKAIQNLAAPNWFSGLVTPGVNAGLFSPPAVLNVANLNTNPTIPYSRSANGANTCQAPEFVKGTINVQVQ